MAKNVGGTSHLSWYKDPIYFKNTDNYDRFIKLVKLTIGHRYSKLCEMGVQDDNIFSLDKVCRTVLDWMIAQNMVISNHDVSRMVYKIVLDIKVNDLTEESIINCMKSEYGDK